MMCWTLWTCGRLVPPTFEEPIHPVLEEEEESMGLRGVAWTRRLTYSDKFCLPCEFIDDGEIVETRQE